MSCTELTCPHHGASNRAIRGKAIAFFEDDYEPLRWDQATETQRGHYTQLAADVIAAGAA